MVELQLNVSGKTTAEMFFHLGKLLQQMRHGQPCGRSQALRHLPDGNETIVTLGKYAIRQSARDITPLPPPRHRVKVAPHLVGH